MANTPVTAGQVVLIPQSTDGPKNIPPSVGSIDSSGNYEIITGGNSGAPAGKYKVIVTPSMVPTEGAKGPPKTSFNQKFQQERSSPLTITVPDSKPGAYDLKLTR